MYYKALKEKILHKRISTCIVGLGYVGLPLLELLIKNKIKCIGIDKDKKKIDFLKKKINNKVLISSNYEHLNKADLVIYSLPTPLDKKKNPDLRILNNSIKNSLPYYKKGQLVILESTSYPGTTKECLKNVIKNFRIGQDFFIGYSPERIDPGNRRFIIQNIPKISSGYTKHCQGLTYLFFSKLIKKVVKASSIEVAEFTKIYENIFRSINIGLANETKQIAKKLKINFGEVLDLASSKPFGFMRFDPGPGVGGHCIPVDPFYLSWLANQKGFKTKFIKLSGEINSNMPKIISREIIKIIARKKILNPKVLILGLSYKKNIDDIRNSPGLEIFKILKKKTQIDFEDKFVNTLQDKNKKYFSRKLKNFSEVKLYDVVILSTDHDYFNYKKILKYSNLIFDLRNKFSQNDKVIKL